MREPEFGRSTRGRAQSTKHVTISSVAHVATIVRMPGKAAPRHRPGAAAAVRAFSPAAAFCGGA
jgi:hypothetical protein